MDESSRRHRIHGSWTAADVVDCSDAALGAHVVRAHSRPAAAGSGVAALDKRLFGAALNDMAGVAALLTPPDEGDDDDDDDDDKEVARMPKPPTTTRMMMMMMMEISRTRPRRSFERYASIARDMANGEGTGGTTKMRRMTRTGMDSRRRTRRSTRRWSSDTGTESPPPKLSSRGTTDGETARGTIACA